MNAHSSSSGTIANRSMPPGIIIPELVYGDMGAAVAWLCETFGFQERLRIGNHRSQLVFGGASVIVVQQSGAGAPGAPGAPDVAVPQPPQGEVTHSIMVRVTDVDRHYEHAKQRGARIINPPTDFPYGERQYTAEDLAGRRWTFSQSIADIEPREWGGMLFEGAGDE